MLLDKGIPVQMSHAVVRDQDDIGFVEIYVLQDFTLSLIHI